MRINETGEEIRTLNGIRYRYNDDDNTRHEVRYEDMNNQKKFEQAVRNKGLWAWFAYTHGIGTYFYDFKQRAKFLGTESAYDEDHFFYITNVPGFEGKKAAFQLRVSNHRTVMSVWEKSHSNGIASVNGNKVERKTLMADFCLNLILNPDKRQEEKIDREMTDKVRVCCIDCYLKYYDYPEGGEQRNQIDDFIAKITNGERPTIDYAELNSLFGRCVTRVSTTKGEPEFRSHNFGDRENQIVGRKTFDFIVNQSNDKVSSFPFSYIIDNDISDGDIFEYKGRNYKFDYDKNCVYFVNSRGKYNEKDPIPVDVNESIRSIGLSLNEIYQMVLSTLREILG